MRLRVQKLKFEDSSPKVNFLCSHYWDTTDVYSIVFTIRGIPTYFPYIRVHEIESAKIKI